MTESYRELFRDFLLECNNGKRWWYLLDADKTDNSSLANLFGTTKQKLTELMVGAKLAQWRAGKEEPTLCFRNDNIKSVCANIKSTWNDHSKHTSYGTATKRVIPIKEGEGPTNARNHFSDEYLESAIGVPVVSSYSIDSTVYCDRKQKQKSKKKKRKKKKNTLKSRWRALKNYNTNNPSKKYI
jgi:hypothetical protein